MRSDVSGRGRKVIAVFSLAALVSNYVPGAQVPDAAGYFMDARQVTVNDTVAAQGLVVLSKSRVKTAPQGFAAISLGKSGQVVITHSASFFLTYSKSGVGGKLDSGSVLVSAPAGVTVSVETAHGTVTTGGPGGANVVVVVSAGQTRVVALDAEAEVVTKSGAKKLAVGEAVNLDEKGPQFRCNRPPLRNAQSGRMSRGELLAVLSGGLATLGVVIGTLVSKDSPRAVSSSPGQVSPVRF
jgi:hypothetical protein